MSLEKLQNRLESLHGIELATTEQDDDWKGTVLYLTISEGHGGDSEEILDEVLDTIPRDFLPQNFDPDERISVYYDAIEIRL